MASLPPLWSICPIAALCIPLLLIVPPLLLVAVAKLDILSSKAKIQLGAPHGLIRVVDTSWSPSSSFPPACESQALDSWRADLPEHISGTCLRVQITSRLTPPGYCWSLDPFIKSDFDSLHQGPCCSRLNPRPGLDQGSTWDQWQQTHDYSQRAASGV